MLDFGEYLPVVLCKMTHDLSQMSLKELALQALGHPNHDTRESYGQEFRRRVQDIRHELIVEGTGRGLSQGDAMHEAAKLVGSNPNESRDFALLGRLDKLAETVPSKHDEPNA